MVEGDVLEERFSKALQVISGCNGDMKDYTYLALLISESRRRMFTEESFKKSGIKDFIAAHMDIEKSTAQLSSLALQFAAVWVTNIQNIEFILVNIRKNLEKICSSDDVSILCSIYELMIEIHDQRKDSSNFSDCAAELVTRRCVADSVIRSLTQFTSYHAVKLATTCFSVILNNPTLVMADGNNHCDNNVHVNYAKVRQNLLVDYFEKSTDRKALLAQLKILLRTSVGEVQNSLAEFIVIKLDFSYLASGAKDFCEIMLKVAVILNDDNLRRKLVEVQDPEIKLTIMNEMLNMNEDRFMKAISDYVAEISSTPLFIKLLRKPNVARILINHPGLQSDVVRHCSNLMEGVDIADAAKARSLTGVLGFLVNLYKLNKLPVEPRIVKFVCDLLARFLGVPDSVKLSCADLMAVFISNMTESSGGLGVDLVSLLGYTALSEGSSWHTKDSSIQALCAFLQNPALRCTEKDLSVTENVIKHAHAHRINFIRSASYRLLQEYVRAAKQIVENDILDRVQATILNDQEAIVRRECVDFLSAWISSCSAEMVPPLSRLMLHLLSRDFDWEVKLKSAKFWEELVDRGIRSAVDPVGSLANLGLFSALTLGLADFEVPVRKTFRMTEDKVRTHLDLVHQSTAKMKKLDIGEDSSSGPAVKEYTPQFEEEDVDDIIEDIVEAGDNDLLTELRCSPLDPVSEVANVPRRSLEDFLVFCKQRCTENDVEDETDELKSLLEDIINSAEDVGLVEVIDCY